jgi:hypothetical protein
MALWLCLIKFLRSLARTLRQNETDKVKEGKIGRAYSTLKK